MFRRKGADLVIEKNLTLVESLCGFDFSITHMDKRTLRVRSNPGQVGFDFQPTSLLSLFFPSFFSCVGVVVCCGWSHRGVDPVECCRGAAVLSVLETSPRLLETRSLLRRSWVLLSILFDWMRWVLSYRRCRAISSNVSFLALTMRTRPSKRG